MKKFIVIASSVIALFLIGCSGASKPSEDDSNRLNDYANASSAPVVASKPLVKTMKSGTWKVGKTENFAAGIIVPGEYVITSPTEALGCYWERNKSLDGEFEGILANGNVDPGSVVRVNVKKTDKALVLKYDCLATKAQ